MKEICDFLEAHAEIMCKDLDLQFLPLAQQPQVAVAQIVFDIKLPFDRNEVFNRQDFPGTFKKRVNEKLFEIAEKAMDAEIK